MLKINWAARTGSPRIGIIPHPGFHVIKEALSAMNNTQSCKHQIIITGLTWNLKNTFAIPLSTSEQLLEFNILWRELCKMFI